MKKFLRFVRGSIGCVLLLPAIIVGWVGFALILLSGHYGNTVDRFVHWHWKRKAWL